MPAPGAEKRALITEMYLSNIEIYPFNGEIFSRIAEDTSKTFNAEYLLFNN
jgi:hypothetical protein